MTSLQLSNVSGRSREESHSRNPSGSLPSHSINTPTQSILPASDGPLTIEGWIRKDGPMKLQESLKKLGLDMTTIKKINLASFTQDQLATEKKRVKNELKRYDSAFEAAFKRPPNREEKEPMRPLYIYYKKLKQYMVKGADKGNVRSHTQNHNPEQPAPQRGLSTTIGSSNPSSQPAQAKKTFGLSMNFHPGEKENKLSGYYNPQPQEKKLDSSFEYHMKDNSKNSELYEPKYNNYFSSGGSSKPVNVKPQNNPPTINYEQVKRELEELKHIRSKLRDKLHAYQVDFTRNNNRKIKYHKDIIPVENEYKRYKEIKAEIARLEGLLGL